MLQVQQVEYFQLPMKTRLPFRYGIAELTELPHLFVRATVEFDGQTVQGISADGLTPKWFTKDPETAYEDHDLPQMLNVIQQAGRMATSAGISGSWFDWWFRTYFSVATWGRSQQVAPLLVSLGFSLHERAVLDAVCRHYQQPLHQLIRSNQLQIDLTAVRPDLTNGDPAAALPASPSEAVIVRHTVGLSDPLTAADMNDVSRPNDSLPLTLEENIQRYGLTHFKIKLSGNSAADVDRLQVIAELCQRTVGSEARFTLDGNENYRNISEFRSQWEILLQNEAVRKFVDQSLLFVEQPIHRDFALEESVRAEVLSWAGAPPLIIDESDCEFSSLPTAMEMGYRGTSHKNCKGIVKSLANAASIAQHRSAGREFILSAEDLGNVGPIALLQDLAVVSLLGIKHVERNGHHYFAGLNHLPADLQMQVVDSHEDLYRRQSELASLQIHDGRLKLESVNDAPFGCAVWPNIESIALPLTAS